MAMRKPQTNQDPDDAHFTVPIKVVETTSGLSPSQKYMAQMISIGMYRVVCLQSPIIFAWSGLATCSGESPMAGAILNHQTQVLGKTR